MKVVPPAAKDKRPAKLAMFAGLEPPAAKLQDSPAVDSRAPMVVRKVRLDFSLPL